MHRIAVVLLGAGLFAILAVAAGPAGARTETGPPPLAAALAASAAGRLDDALAAVAQSARAVGAAYEDLSQATPKAVPEDRGRWLAGYAAKDGAVAFGDRQNPRSPSLYFYDGENFTDDTFRQLSIMSRLAPVLVAAHDALPASWVYLTTPGQNFCIYPPLGLDEAVNNSKPTEQDFYKAADFEAKACGWQSPYLDLAGAGMMVTVSCPVYDGETLLAVASRDVTLAQLSRRVMAEAAALPGARAMLMNRRGKAIAASRPDVAAFIDAENGKAGDAVVYFRADRGLAAMSLEKGVNSPDGAANAAAEAVIERAGAEKDWPMAFVQDKDLVLAARLETTGWYLVLLVPQKAAR